MRHPATQEALERRRLRAASLLLDGKSVAETARLVSAGLTSVKRWKQALEQGGVEALAAKPIPGRKSKLSQSQKERLVEILLEGPIGAGYSTDLWTCPRVAEVIKDRFGVTYHPDHVGRLLHALGFSPQKPERRAREADRDAIEHWRKVEWPRIKKRDASEKLALFSSMKAAFNFSL